MFRETVKNTVQNEYGVIKEKTDAFDTFQRQVSEMFYFAQKKKTKTGDNQNGER